MCETAWEIIWKIQIGIFLSSDKLTLDIILGNNKMHHDIV